MLYEYGRHKGAFVNGSFSSVIIGDDVTSIGDNAFYGCIRLEKVTIGKNVKEIVGKPFRDCKALKYIYCKASTPPTVKSSLYILAEYIYVPRNSVGAYNAAYNWKGENILPYDF